MTKTIHTIGMGEPEPQGKQSLFRPAIQPTQTPADLPAVMEQGSRKHVRARMRTTIELSVHTLELIQNIQTRHRARTGKVFPIWKLVGLALESYAATHSTQGEENLR